MQMAPWQNEGKGAFAHATIHRWASISQPLIDLLRPASVPFEASYYRSPSLRDDVTALSVVTTRVSCHRRRGRRRNPSAKDEEAAEAEEIYMRRAEGDYSEE